MICLLTGAVFGLVKIKAILILPITYCRGKAAWIVSSEFGILYVKSTIYFECKYLCRKYNLSRLRRHLFAVVCCGNI
jgi:hypothetical protein